jgi:hypothetical protein
VLKNSRKLVYLYIPFPLPSALKLLIPSGDTIELRALVLQQTKMPNPLQEKGRKKVVLINHQRNEEFLLPFFIIHHSSMFDKAIIIGFKSSDKSAAIFDQLVPASWTMIQSNTGSIFDTSKLEQVMNLEIGNPDCWHLALTTTAFLIESNFRLNLMKSNESMPNIRRYQLINMIGTDAQVLSDKLPLPFQRNQGIIVHRKLNPYRYLHLGTENTHRYSTGRHRYVAQGNQSFQPQLSFGPGFIMTFIYTPWPEIIDRKISVGLTIPRTDIRRKRGMQHTEILNNASALDVRRKDYLEINAKSIIALCDFNFYDGVFHDTWSLNKEFNQNFGHCLNVIQKG